jgi:hypothetical protein
VRTLVIDPFLGVIKEMEDMEDVEDHGLRIIPWGKFLSS